MRPAKHLLALGVGIALLAPAACGPGEGARSLEPADHVPATAGELADFNVVLVTLDTTRADRIGCYGNRAIQTPNLDRLAADGLLFSRASAVAPTTLPSHASILTGLYPVHHGARANGLFRLDDGHVTLAERLRDAGWRTGAFVSAFVLDSQYGLEQGFEHYDDDLSDSPDPLANHYPERAGEKTTARALRWLDGVRTERFFLWVHLFDPHHEYAPPPPFAERYASDPYDGEIAFVDACVGRIMRGLAERGLKENTLVAVIGDHGEGRGQHSEGTHSYLVYESTMWVPWLLWAGERLSVGRYCNRLVSQVDFAPLVLQLLGLDGSEALDGQDLLRPPVGEQALLFETLAGALEFGWQPLFGVGRGSYRYIHSSQPELFDLARDPGQLENLIDTEPDVAAELRDRLFALLPEGLALPSPTLTPSQEELETLRGLGYLAGDGAPSEAGDDGMAVRPQDAVHLFHRVELAKDPNRPLAERLADLEAIAAEHPDFFPVWKAIGEQHRNEGNAAAAAEAIERCLELRPDNAQAKLELALVRSAMKQTDEALRLLEPVVASYPDYVRARYLYGTLLAGKGQLETAIGHLRAVFALDPGHERCIEHLANASALARRTPEVKRLFRDHLAARPADARVRIALASLIARDGDKDSAATLLREGLRLSPDPALKAALEKLGAN